MCGSSGLFSFLYRRPLLLVLSLILSSCAGGPEVSGLTYRLTGVTRYQGKALSSGEILLMKAEPGGAVYRTPVGAQGGFRFKVPPGAYFLMGSGADPVSGRRLFAFWNNNPLPLYSDLRETVVLPFVPSTGTPVTDQDRGIKGRVLHDGEPLSGAVVAAFLDAGGQFHGPPYAESLPTGEKGEFFLDVMPGRYFLLARLKPAGGPFQGPLLRGDLAGFYPHNPVFVRSGEGLVLDIPLAEVNRPRGEGSLALGESIIVQGHVRTVTGDPVPGVRVVVYSVPEMLGRPLFVSSPSDPDGSYRLEVPRSGQFYLAARSVIGKPPETGELMGYYDGSPDHAIRLKMGDRLDGVDIVVRERW